MTALEFFNCLHAYIRRYNLLDHPFYKAWSAGELTRRDLQIYAKQYYRQVESFPRYLIQLARRLPIGDLRSAIIANLGDEIGRMQEQTHADLWLRFAEGMGVSFPFEQSFSAEMEELLFFYNRISTHGTPEEAMTAFYVYESQVPRISEAKFRGLKQLYDADDATCEYFTVHVTADVAHSATWSRQLEKCFAANPHAAEGALVVGEAAARYLWNALTGVEQSCLNQVLQAS